LRQEDVFVDLFYDVLDSFAIWASLQFTIDYLYQSLGKRLCSLELDFFRTNNDFTINL
jgi:hypothetical protein